MQPATPEPASTRDRLLAAAFEALEEKGLAGCRVTDIAKRAGVAPGSIYVHFEDKAALVAEALARVGDGRLPRLTDDLDGEGAADALIVMGQRLLSGEGSALERALLQLWATSLADPAARHRIVSDFEISRENTAEAYRKVQSVYLADGVPPVAPLEPLRPDVVSTFGLVLLFGTVVAKALGFPLLDPADAAKVVDHLTSMSVGSAA